MLLALSASVTSFIKDVEIADKSQLRDCDLPPRPSTTTVPSPAAAADAARSADADADDKGDESASSRNMYIE